MVNEMDYGTISLVIDSWEQLKRTKNYEVVAGSILFQHLFVQAPQTKVLFGFPIDIDVSDELVKSKRFTMHASYMVQMLDTALNLLGPDSELLTEILLELGAKHQRYGVKPAMFETMGESILFTLEKVLGDEFDKATRVAWTETYEAIKQDMIRAQKKGGN